MSSTLIQQSIWIGAGDAARLLGVTRATLYAYVSRGLVRSQPGDGRSRERRYAREDLERLRKRAEARRHPDEAAAGALQWGVPVLETAITCLDGARLYYRGHDTIELARTRTVEDVASLIWTGGFGTSWPPAAGFPSMPRQPFVGRAQTLLAAAPLGDPGAFDCQPAGVAATGWRIVHLLTTAAAGTAHTAGAIEERLARAWRVGPRGVTLLRRALILCADHELNVSSFTARCVASAGSHPYAVVGAALAALEGPRHGGAGARVEAMLESLRRSRSLKTAVADRLRRGEPVDGLGHPLYRNGDPRAAAILDGLRQDYPRSGELAFLLETARVLAGATREHPNLDFGLAALARVLALPPGAPLMLFAIGRSIGWIGHAIEQYATGQLIRPRAKYSGVAPLTVRADD
jgi:citrate synthase